jgi:uncharacterized membrane protein
MFKHHKTYNQIAGRKVPRTEALADGVFAFAFTLLALDFRLPVTEAIATEAEFYAAFDKLIPKFLTYFLSFMTLGIFWTSHTLQFTYITKSDRNLTWFNLFFLMLVTLLPYTTAFLSEYITFKFTMALYWFHLFCLGLILLLHWNYAYKHGYIVNDTENLSVNKAIQNRIILAVILYTLGALFYFINPILSISVIILIHLNFALAPFSHPAFKRRSK